MSEIETYENDSFLMENFESDVLKDFSIDRVDEKYRGKDLVKKLESYKKKYKAALKTMNEKNSTIFKKISSLKVELKKTSDKAEIDRINKAIEAEYNKIEKAIRVMPATDLPTYLITSVIASGEYIDKPYDTEKLAIMVELSQRLKSCINCVATNSTKKGVIYEPTIGHTIDKFKDEELKEYHRQGIKLLKWYKKICGTGKDLPDLAYEQILTKLSLGESYIEQIETMMGTISKVQSISPIFIWETPNRDKYLWVRDGMKKYFKKYSDNEIRSCYDFSKGRVPLMDRANKLIPFKEYSIISDVYGIPNWTPSIPAIVGNRYAAERNVSFFSNDAVPRMVVIVSGGSVDESTKKGIQDFFRRGKGFENSGRVLVMCISAKNQMSPDTKPPTVKMEPLTVGKQDDASFTEYQLNNNAQITESFRLAETFLGVVGDSNRASSYTLRDQTVETVFKPESEAISAILNDYLTRAWAIEEGYLKIDPKTGEEIANNLLVQIKFNIPRTMSEKDQKELEISEVTAGIVTINDYRVAHNMDIIDRWWAYLPKPLLVPAIQMSELAPNIIQSLTPYDEYNGDDTSKVDTSKSIVDSYDFASKTICELKKAINTIFDPNIKTVDEETLKKIDAMYKLNRIAHTHE